MARVPLPVKAGDAIAYPVTFKDEDGVGIELTGTTWRAQARDPGSGDLIATFGLTPAPDQATTGKGLATLTATTTESAKLRGGEWLDVEDTTAHFTWLEFVLDVSKDMARA